MPREDEETPPCKREHGETAGSSTASRDALPGTEDKEQGPWTQGGVHGPSPSGQAERSESEGAPQEQPGQVPESPSISREGM